MPEENLAIIREWYDHWVRGDTEGWEAVVHPDVEWHDAPDDPDGGVHRGIAGVQAVFDRWTEAFDEVRGVPMEMLDAGDRVFVWQKTFCRGAASGANVVWEGGFVWTLRDGKIGKVQIFVDRAEALDAAGLSE